MSDSTTRPGARVTKPSDERVALHPEPDTFKVPDRRTRPGTILADQYELTERIGTGGMAEVWRGFTLGANDFRRPIAVKKILPNLVGQPEFAALFTEEARVVAALQHPNIVPIYDFRQDDLGQYFIVMEYVEGLDVGRWIISHLTQKLPTPVPVLVEIGIAILRGLSVAHERLDALGEPSPVFHRDVTPSNVLMSKHGAIKLGDFGISRAMDRMTMTTPGVVRGKIAYVAPELLAGKRASVASDLYGVGVLLWEAATRRRLHEGLSDFELFVKAGKGEHDALGEIRPDVPVAFVQVVDRLLALNPAERYPSAHAAIEDLAAAAPPLRLDSIARSVAIALEATRR